MFLVRWYSAIWCEIEIIFGSPTIPLSLEISVFNPSPVFILSVVKGLPEGDFSKDCSDHRWVPFYPNMENPNSSSFPWKSQIDLSYMCQYERILLGFRSNYFFELSMKFLYIWSSSPRVAAGIETQAWKCKARLLNSHASSDSHVLLEFKLRWQHCV